jgi:hypothetical protein
MKETTMTEVDEQPRKRQKDMTPDERREHRRIYMQEYRKEQAGEAKADDSETREEFWGKNRKLLASSELAALVEKQERVRDQQYWMRCWADGSYNDPASPHYTDPNDAECYVGLAEGVADLVEFVRNHPCPRTYGWNSSGGALSHLWSTDRFWTNPKTMELIAAEGYATEVWARYGYWTGIEDAEVYFFLTDTLRRLGHKPWTGDAVNKLVGLVVGSDGSARYPKVSP